MRSSAVFALGLLLVACGGEGDVLPAAPVEAGTGGAEPQPDPSTSSGGGSEPSPAPQRQVYQRNPFGNVAASGNLLWDGDFEWMPAFASQYGWIQANNQSFFGAGLPKSVLGGACRSGVRCARLEGNNVLLGLAVVSSDNDLSVSFWVRPETEASDCQAVEAILVSQEGSEPSIPIAAGPMGDDGWCRFATVVPVRGSAQYLYMHNSDVVESFLVDDAVIVRASEAPPEMLAYQPQAAGPVDPALSDHVRKVGRTITQPQDPPKSEAQKAFEARLKRGWKIGGAR